MATVLVALAATEFRPSHISAGNETRVPPPATELMAPATNAAPNATAACVRVNAGVKLPAYRTAGGALWTGRFVSQSKAMTRRRWMGAMGCLAGDFAACRRTAELPPGLLPETAAGGWRRISLRKMPVAESPDPVPRTAVESLLAASYGGPGKLEARVYALSSPGAALELTQRWRPSADTVFFARGRVFVVVKWQAADRKLLREFVAEMEERLAAGIGSRK